jgi:hypothetical protein
VQRTVLTGAAPETTRVAFPQLKPHQEFDKDFVHPSLSYGSEFIAQTLDPSASGIVYETDSRGYVLTEKRYGEDGVLLSELANTWARDRLAAVDTRTFDENGAVMEKKRIEFEYDGQGNRVLEQDFVNGVLERTVKSADNQEIEELYRNGKIVLRAVWENGRKIKEEQVR